MKRKKLKRIRITAFVLAAVMLIVTAAFAWAIWLRTKRKFTDRKQSSTSLPKQRKKRRLTQRKAAKRLFKVCSWKTPIMDNIKLALQGYNYGNGYIQWAQEHYEGYSTANALEYSDLMAKKKGWSSYGDSNYVLNVLRYYPIGRAFTAGGNQVIVEIASAQLGNKGGKPYWSRYGFKARIAWCACYVSWCADQYGYIDAGIIPKFQLCSDGVVYNIEGNSGDACKRQRYTVGSRKVFCYGFPIY